MAGEKVVAAKRPAKPEADATAKRERSTIEFPYGDMDDALQVVRAIHTNSGTTCTTDQLAAYLNQSLTSGSFRTKAATAGVFGVVTSERGNVTMTDLGRRIVDSARARQATTEAFLTVPLYRAVFEKYKGHTLPPAAALEREMVALGVAAKIANKARQAFERSAEQAGFFAHGKDRLVMPAGGGGAATQAKDDPPVNSTVSEKAARTGGGGGGDDGYHPFIQGLLRKLPEAETTWNHADRVKWLEAAIRIFDLMYQSDDAGHIKVQLEKP